MKERTGFVSNSSSSSFVISKQYLTEEQIDKIKRHSEVGKELGISYSDDPWKIDEETVDGEELLYGSTWCDNFNMEYFLREIGVDTNRAEWSEMTIDVGWIGNLLGKIKFVKVKVTRADGRVIVDGGKLGTINVHDSPLIEKMIEHLKENGCSLSEDGNEFEVADPNHENFFD